MNDVEKVLAQVQEYLKSSSEADRVGRFKLSKHIFEDCTHLSETPEGECIHCIVADSRVLAAIALLYADSIVSIVNAVQSRPGFDPIGLSFAPALAQREPEVAANPLKYLFSSPKINRDKSKFTKPTGAPEKAVSRFMNKVDGGSK